MTWAAAIAAVATPASAQLDREQAGERWAEYPSDEAPPPRPALVELAPMLGYAFRSSAEEPYAYGATDVGGSATYGLALGIGDWSGARLVASYRLQRTDVEYDGATSGAAERLFGLSLHHVQVGGEYDIVDGDVRPFVGGGIGVAVFAPQADFRDELRFELSVHGGVKVFLTEHVGVRLQGQVAVIVLDAKSDIFCSEACVSVVSGLTAMPQLALTGGPIVAF